MNLWGETKHGLLKHTPGGVHLEKRNRLCTRLTWYIHRLYIVKAEGFGLRWFGLVSALYGHHGYRVAVHVVLFRLPDEGGQIVMTLCGFPLKIP